MATKLSLGPLPSGKKVKLTIPMSLELKAELDRYADAYSRTFGDNVQGSTLIPYMLQTFMERDSEYQRLRKGKGVG